MVDTLLLKARVGEVLDDRWRLERLLGAGGFGAVYAAEHVRSARKAAIKVLHDDFPLTREDVARFILEARVVNAIAHPGVVPVEDDGKTAKGSPFFVMALLEGETVEAHRRRVGGRVDAAFALSVADRVLDVMAVAHARNVVHRDIKPENLYLTTAGELKVLDFGLARCRELSTASNPTRSGSWFGTLPFMPPEQAQGDWARVDGRTDLWAVGATLFTLLTGQFVHDERTQAGWLLAATTRRARAIRDVVPGLPGEVAVVVDRALAFDMADRWPDARAMQAAVKGAAHA